MKIWRTWPSTVFGLTTSASQMPWLEWPSAISASTSRSRSVSSSSGPCARRALISRDTIVGSTTHSPSSMRRSASTSTASVGHALLEQVADALGRLLEQPQRVARLEVVGEHEHADVGVLAADLLRGDEPVVGVAGRHADVEDRHVRPRQRDAAQRLRRRAPPCRPPRSRPRPAAARALRAAAPRRRRALRARELRDAGARRPSTRSDAAEGADAVVEVDQLRPRRHGGVDGRRSSRPSSRAARTVASPARAAPPR